MNIFVANLNFRSSSEDLRTLFEKYGEVSSANVITDKMSGRSRGFGFVEMPDEAQAQQAIQELNNTEFDGKVIAVSVARPRTERPQRNFRSNSRDNWNRNDRNQY